MIKPVVPAQWDMVLDWFAARTGVRPSPDVLSDFGFMYYTGDKPVACLFVFPVAGSKICMLGWPMSDPHSDKEIRNWALDSLLEFCEQYARDLGYFYTCTWASHKAVEDRFKKHNYYTGDTGVSYMVKGLGRI